MLVAQTGERGTARARSKTPGARSGVCETIIDPFHPMSVIWLLTTWPREQRHVSFREKAKMFKSFNANSVFIWPLIYRSAIDLFQYFSQTVAAKVRNLHDYQLRLLNSSVSPPSGHDVANTLKYFSQMLLGKSLVLLQFEINSKSNFND